VFACMALLGGLTSSRLVWASTSSHISLQLWCPLAPYTHLHQWCPLQCHDSLRDQGILEVTTPQLAIPAQSTQALQMLNDPCDRSSMRLPLLLFPMQAAISTMPHPLVATP
jgi:hypothetical protein